MMMGKRPYVGKSRREIRDHIFAKQVQIKKYNLPENWSFEAADFINKLLQRKPANRLGLNGPEEVKDHIWLKDTDWSTIISKRHASPYLPNKDNDNFDAVQANATDQWNQMNVDVLKQNTLLLRQPHTQDLFNGYYYNNDTPQTAPTITQRPKTANTKPIAKHRKTFSLKW
jgi:protein kinase A